MLCSITEWYKSIQSRTGESSAAAREMKRYEMMMKKKNARQFQNSFEYWGILWNFLVKSVDRLWNN